MMVSSHSYSPAKSDPNGAGSGARFRGSTKLAIGESALANYGGPGSFGGGQRSRTGTTSACGNGSDPSSIGESERHTGRRDKHRQDDTQRRCGRQLEVCAGFELKDCRRRQSCQPGAGRRPEDRRRGDRQVRCEGSRNYHAHEESRHDGGSRRVEHASAIFVGRRHACEAARNQRQRGPRQSRNGGGTDGVVRSDRTDQNTTRTWISKRGLRCRRTPTKLRIAGKHV